MVLATGKRLGPYEILAPLGQGGMGEVYKARDTRLDRTVAIKILHAYVASDADFQQRFEREAKVISSLDHPHIRTLYDVGVQDGIDFLVMQYLEGETLADRLARAPRSLSLDQVLAFAIQIADALDKAHRRGITHRDVKPGNIFLVWGSGSSDPPTAKLLDFGLAKLAPPREAVTVAGLTAAPTVDTPLTGQGTIVGTLQYMAPEQLEGKEADARTDIFAFGAVLYEMATGRKAFEGKSQASLIGAILKDEPPPLSSALNAGREASAAADNERTRRLGTGLQRDGEKWGAANTQVLNRLVKKCLAKDPDDRWQTAHDLLDELKWVTEAGSETDVSAPTAQGAGALMHQPESGLKTRRYGWIVAAVVVVASLSAAVVVYFRPPAIDTKVYRSTFVPPAALSGFPPASLALSPDGRRLAFVAPGPNGRDVLWIRPLEGLTAQPLSGTEDATAPFWSPDSRSIAFVAGGKLKRIEASGGPALTLSETAGSVPGTWNQENVILFNRSATAVASSQIFRVTAAGGTSSPVTALDPKAGDLGHGFPFFLPDGRQFLYVAFGASATAGGVYAGSLDSPDRTRLLEGVSNAQYARGHLLYLRDTTLMAQPFDPKGLVLGGEAVPLAEQVRVVGLNAALGTFTVSEAGILAYQQAAGGAGDSRLVWFDRGGRQTGVLGDRARYGGVIEGLGTNDSSEVNLSPDGGRAAVSVRDAGGGKASDIWIFDVARGLRTRFTIDPAAEGTPLWSPDGTRVVFRSGRKGHQDLYQKVASGTGTDDLLLADGTEKFTESWSPDGRFLLYFVFNPAQQKGDEWVLPLFGDRKPFPFLQSPFNQIRGQFSPDGHWVAYQSNESGQFEVYVAPFPGPGAKTQISTAGGREARWRRDGKEIFFLAGNKMMAAAVAGSGARFEVGAIQPLFDVRAASGQLVYDVSRDGRFLVNVVEEQTAVAPLTLVVNWPAALRK